MAKTYVPLPLQESAVILCRLVLKRAVEHLSLQEIRLIIMEKGRLKVRPAPINSAPSKPDPKTILRQ